MLTVFVAVLDFFVWLDFWLEGECCATLVFCGALAFCTAFDFFAGLDFGVEIDFGAAACAAGTFCVGSAGEAFSSE